MEKILFWERKGEKKIAFIENRMRWNVIGL